MVHGSTTLTTQNGQTDLDDYKTYNVPRAFAATFG